ncbi:MAG TPA: PASTA domain-containing protein [Actinomycetota bacterium]|nr:PASTA domain-containing protein [Actinomycetota bacterium]
MRAESRARRGRVAAAIAAIALLAACASARPGDGRRREGDGRVVVPDVAGLPEAEAVKALAGAGLVAAIERSGRAPTGVAAETEPPPGARVPAGTVVDVIVGRPAVDRPAPEGDARFDALARIVDEHPDAFVGLYVERGSPVVVLGPDAEEEPWLPRLRAAAGRAALRVERCARSRRALEAVQAQVGTRSWATGPVAFASYVDASTCSVRVVGDLSDADARSLTERFGSRVTIDRSGRAARTRGRGAR